MTKMTKMAKMTKNDTQKNGPKKAQFLFLRCMESKISA